MAWILVPCLVALREEFNAVSPSRDKGADGSIGDSSHTSSSDHTPDEDSDVLRDHDADDKNEVHALDIDSSGPWPAPGWFDRTVLGIVAREKARWLDPDDVCRLEYVIWDGHIYSRAYDFAKRVYSLAWKDPHTNHVHFSSRYLTTSENDTSPWGVNVLSTEDKEWLTSLVSPTTKGVKAALQAEPGLVSKPVENLLLARPDLMADGFRAALWDAAHAARTQVPAADGSIAYVTGKDPVYDAADSDGRKKMRNTLQLLQELGIVARPVFVPPAP